MPIFKQTIRRIRNIFQIPFPGEKTEVSLDDIDLVEHI